MTLRLRSFRPGEGGARLIRALLISVSLLFPALFPTAAFAWSGKVHQLICEMAWQQLRPETKRFIDSIRHSGNDDQPSFSSSCAWADAVRDEERSTYEYHFLNLARGANAVSLERDCPAHDCVLVAIDRYLHYVVARPQGTREEERRLRALKFLAHFVGDLHQPMHVAYGDDRGGNAIAVRFHNADANLHGVWDFELPEASVPREGAARALLAAQSATDVARWQDGDLLAWADESFQLARNVGYPMARDHLLSDDEVAKARGVVTTQLRKAAARLAFLLDQAAQGRDPLPSLWHQQ